MVNPGDQEGLCPQCCWLRLGGRGAWTGSVPGAALTSPGGLEGRVQGLLTDVSIVIQSNTLFSVRLVFIDHPYIEGQLIFNKGTKTIQWGKNNLKLMVLGQLDTHR